MVEKIKTKNYTNNNKIIIISLIIGILLLIGIGIYFSNNLNTTSEKIIKNSENIKIIEEKKQEETFNNNITEKTKNITEEKTEINFPLTVTSTIDKNSEDFMIEKLELALKKNDANKCNDDYKNINECKDHFYFINAIKNNNLENCNKITSILPMKESCQNIIKNKNCDNLKDSDMNILCNSALNLDNKKCDTLKEKKLSNYCNQIPYIIDSLKNNDKEICNKNKKESISESNKITENNWKILCLNLFK